MLKQAMRWILIPVSMTLIVACGGSSTSTSMGSDVITNPAAYRLPEVISAVPPQN